MTGIAPIGRTGTLFGMSRFATSRRSVTEPSPFHRSEHLFDTTDARWDHRVRITATLAWVESYALGRLVLTPVRFSIGSLLSRAIEFCPVAVVKPAR